MTCGVIIPARSEPPVRTSMQDKLDRLNENYVEQLRISNNQRFGRKTEKLQKIEGQLSLFN